MSRLKRKSGKAALPRRRVYRETPDVTEGVCRLIRSIGKRVAEEDTDSLAQLRRLDAALAEAWEVAIGGLRGTYSDPQIGKALGVSRQAIEQRWPRKRQHHEEDTA